MKEKLILGAIIGLLFMGCEKEEFTDIPIKSKPDVSMVERFCCDWDAANYEPYVNGICVTEAYFRNSTSCDDTLCIYNNY